jgi:hypothetical protein
VGHEEYGVRSGCVNYILKLGTAVAAAILLSVGALVLLFGAFNLSPSGGIRTVITVVAALGAVYLFTRVGKDILRDLRDERTGDDEEKSRSSDRSG